MVEPAGLVTRLTVREPAPSSSAGVPNEVRAVVHWALLADPHISADPSRNYNGFYPEGHVRAAVEQVLKAGPQAALIAGDLSWDQGPPQDYARLRAILDPLAEHMPVSLMPGNHDSRAAFLAEFCPAHAQAQPTAEKSIIVVEHGPVRWILLDSLFRSGIVAGLLGKAQRCWLQRLLEASDKRTTLIAVHHPLDDDDDSLLDGDRLLRLVQSFSNVKAIVTAHDHAYRIESRDGLHIVSLPALGMPFDEQEPVGWVEASLSASEGVFTFHAVGENKAGDGASTTLRWR